MPEKRSISITERTEFGSRSARRLRRSGSVPAVVYGRGGDEINVTVSEKEFMDTVGYSTSTGIISLEMGRTSPITAIVKDIQWDMLTDRPVHIDFLRVSADQVVSIPVHLHLENIPVGVRMGGVLEHALHEIYIKVRARDIPSTIEVDVANMDIGSTLHLRDIILPEGMSLDMDDELVVASVVAPSVAKAAASEEAEAGEGETLPAGAEGTPGKQEEETSEPEED
ncbi:MAG: hypothetical protein AVO35_09365 [Candidatus Aegiribacteria sp. MLS_C]|nr:MAG: hypothetical protein AVO35_09365 [Candidatus Aegiribacteria sp. MLS_C]